MLIDDAKGALAALKAERVGHLTAEDEAKILPLVASCGFIDAHMRKVYRIGQK